jgi:hypothetical protein
MKTGKFGMTGKKALFKGFGHPEVVVMDVTETAIERKKKPNKYYSFNKKCHSLKMPVVINQETDTDYLPTFGTGAWPRFQLV